MHNLKLLVNPNWSYSPETLNLGQNWRCFFCPVWPWNLTDDLEKQYSTSSILCQAQCIISKPLVNSNWSHSPETLNSGQNWRFFCRVTFKFDGWPWKTIGHMFYTMSSFMHHLKPLVDSNWSYSPETLNSGQNWFFFIPCDLEIWRMTLKNNMAPLHTMSSFMHHLKTIGKFKLELQSRNSQFGSKLIFFYTVWPWNLTDDLDQGKSDGFDSCDRPSNLTQIGFKLSIFRPCDLEIWWMTPKNNNILLYNIKLCVSFHIHQWIQSGVTVRKRPIWVKLDYFF